MTVKVEQEFYPLQGGLDLMTPAIALDPGKCFDAQNYEPLITGGYGRISGYERFDGRPSPTSAVYATFAVNLTGAVNVGDTLTGATSGATCKVLQIVTSQYIVVGRLGGTFQAGETLTDGVTVGTVTSVPQIGGAVLPSDDANYTLLAANDYRASIGAVPGSGRVRGVQLYDSSNLNSKLYAFRDNAGGTANLMYVATANGWQQINFGYEVQLATLNHAATVTITNASPGVVTWTGHGMVNNQPVQLSVSAGGSLPAPLTSNFTYYVVAATANTFELASSIGGTAINTTAAGSGTFTCTAMGNNIFAGNVVRGATSGATATVAASLLRTGSWTANLVGNLVVPSVTGTFNASEILTVAGIMVANTASTQTAITRAPGGTMEFCNINFTGSATGYKMYGADGVNPAFEFDGTTYVPLHTGSTPDTPAHVINFKEMLFLAIGGNLIISALGNPYNYDTINGSGDIGVGDLITAFQPQGGTYITGSTMAIFSTGHMFTLYGSSTANFNLITSIWDMGFSPYTTQVVSNDTYGWTSRGIQTIITTLTFGDFDYNSISHEIQKLINARQGLQIASTALHQKDQYRVFFSDGTALVVGLTGQKPNGIMPLNYGLNVRCICTGTTAAGQELTYFGSDNGFVYQDNIGTSQDGNPITAWIRLAFNHSKSPRVRKRYLRAILEGVVDSYAQINFSYDLGYGNPDTQPSAAVSDTSFTGAGGYWDQFTWDQFMWDSQIIAAPSFSLEGTEKNISMLIYSSYAQYQPHTIQGVTLIYSSRRLER